MAEGRALLIVNRASGQGDATTVAAERALGRAGFDVDAVSPDDPGDISGLIRERGPACDRIVLGGGDGTFSHSAQALIDAGRPVGLLPLGTANDLARTLRLPADIAAAAEVAAGKRSRPIDLGTINGRPFFNVASMGFSARVAAYHAGERKKRLKMLSYPLSWLDAQRDLEPFHARLSYGKRRRRIRTTMLAVGNGVHFGGGLMIADNAAIDDGWLDVFYVKPLGPIGLLKLLPFLKFGAIRRRQDVRLLRTRAIDIDAEPHQDINVDGEVVERTPARFGVLREALEVYVPGPD
jgi:YegS/Rv2252/BmrU family lipid kinase